jgi:hypothetical protein
MCGSIWLELKISDIRYKAAVLVDFAWTEQYPVSVDVNGFCSGWELDVGRSGCSQPGPPYLDRAGFSEAAVNFFLGMLSRLWETIRG